MLARTAAAFLSDKLDTEVKIKTFYIKPDLRIHAEEVQINDKMHYPMLYVGTLNAKLSLRDLANELRVKNISIDDLLVNLVKYEDSYVIEVGCFLVGYNFGFGRSRGCDRFCRNGCVSCVCTASGK